MKDYFNNKYTLFKTRTKVFPGNNSKNKNMYLNLNPENQENDYNNTYQNFFQYNNINNPQGHTYIPLNVINNNISSNDRIYQKYYYINERNTPLHNYYTNNNHPNTTYHNNIYKEKNVNIGNNNDTSPIRGFIENQNFDYYINEKLNKRKKLEQNDYINKSAGFKFLNRTMSFYNNKSKLYTANNMDKINQKENQYLKRKNDMLYLNIYRQKLIKVFVQNINKIIEKNKKKEIMIIFFNNLKKGFYKKRSSINYFNNKKIQNDPKYNEYKDMIYNYIKSKNNLPMSKIYNILKPLDKSQFNTINNASDVKNNIKNKIRNESNKNSYRVMTQKNEIEKFKKLQKKYGKIYEKKTKEISSFEDKINNYINHKTIESTSSINPDNDISRKKKVFKHKRKIEKNLTNYNLTDGKKKENINLINESDRNTNNNMAIKEYKTKNITKRKKRLDSQSSSKSFKTISEIRNIYNIYIIKNIISADKRLYVNIKYIFLDHKKKENNFYTNDTLEKSENINITIKGYNITKNNDIKHKKKLSKIEEEVDDKINTNLSQSIKEEKYHEKKEADQKKNINSIKGSFNSNNMVYNPKKFSLTNLKRKYINYQKLQAQDNNEN